jgi:eukaryotic-like serine/threonine-protein kinase
VGLTVAASVTLARVRGGKTKLGAYTLSRLIGEGGMSKVYLARHALLRRPTAVKVLKEPHATSPEAILRFEREVQAASGLTHPNTIQIYDFGQTPGGTFYYAMEYLAGLNLAELVTLEGPIVPERVVHILKQVCGSLREAHEQGILHRDIKPLNIMLCERGGQCDFVKVLDFGLVRHLDGPATLEITAVDRLIGTPLYMAPERFANPTAADPRSDLYSVGAVAYFLLTGRPVFQALTGLDLQNQVLHMEPESPSQRVPHPISARLERLVLECLSKDPASRPPSAAAVLEALESLPDVGDWTRQEAREWWVRNVPGLLKTAS